MELEIIDASIVLGTIVLAVVSGKVASIRRRVSERRLRRDLLPKHNPLCNRDTYKWIQ